MDKQHTENSVTILGINGRIGQEIAKAFVKSGWRVVGMGRENRAQIQGVEFCAGNADSVTDIEHAIAESAIVVNALNLPYDKWDKGRAEAQLQRVLDALTAEHERGRTKTLMFPGNIYNYAKTQLVLTPETPFAPEKEKGEIRVRMENMIEATAQRGILQAMIIRTADFYAPFATETNFDLAILARKKSKILQSPTAPDMAHSWAYLPDVAKVYVKLAARKSEFGAFETFHHAGHFLRGDALMALVQKALPEPYAVKPMPWGLLRVIGWFVPLVREVVKMGYLFNTPHRLKDERLAEILGPDFGTPVEEAVAITVRSYITDVPDNSAQAHLGQTA